MFNFKVGITGAKKPGRPIVRTKRIALIIEKVENIYLAASLPCINTIKPLISPNPFRFKNIAMELEPSLPVSYKYPVAILWQNHGSGIRVNSYASQSIPRVNFIM